MGINTFKLPLGVFLAAILTGLLLTQTIIAGENQTQGEQPTTWQSERQALQTLEGWSSEHQWEQVISGGDRFLQQYPRSDSESSVRYLIAEAALSARRLDRALVEIKRLQLKFPTSAYADDARWILAQCALAAEKWDQAAEEMRWIISFSTDARLVEDARARLEELKTFLDLLHPEPAEVDSVNTGLKVSLVLPLTGALSEEAKQFITGFETTWQQFSPVEVKIFDSGDDPVQAALVARQTIHEDGAWAVVGGFSEAETAAMAAIAESENTPFVTTACPAEGIAAIGRNVFQGRADYGLIGRKLANHLLAEKGAGHFGILTPTTQEGRQIARGFKQELIEAGADVIAEEMYYPGAKEFKSYFERIRQAGFRQAFKDSLRLFYEVNGYLMLDQKYGEDPMASYFTSLKVQWLDEYRYQPSVDYLCPQALLPGIRLDTGEEPALTISPAMLDTLWENAQRRIRRWMNRNYSGFDSLSIKLKIFDGFLWVIESNMTAVAAPQFTRANIPASLVGNEAWDTPDAVFKNQNYLEGMVFPRGITGLGDTEYCQFATEITGDSLGRVAPWHLYGDRAARIIAFAAARANSRDEMRITLSQIRDLKTMSGEVSFLKEERVDRNVNLMKVHAGKIEPLVISSDPFLEP